MYKSTHKRSIPRACMGDGGSIRWAPDYGDLWCLCNPLPICRINSNSDFADILKKANTFLFIIHHPLYPLQCSSNDNNDNNCVIFCETVVLARSTELLQKAALHYLRLTESGQILL